MTLGSRAKGAGAGPGRASARQEWEGGRQGPRGLRAAVGLAGAHLQPDWLAMAATPSPEGKMAVARLKHSL